MDSYEFYIIVLEKTEAHEKLISALNNRGIKGATSVTSNSMESSLATQEDSHIISALRAFMTADRVESKTIFGVCIKEKVTDISAALNEVLGDINRPNTAMFVSLPISSVDGIFRTEKLKK